MQKFRIPSNHATSRFEFYIVSALVLISLAISPIFARGSFFFHFFSLVPSPITPHRSRPLPPLTQSLSVKSRNDMIWNQYFRLCFAVVLCSSLICSVDAQSLSGCHSSDVRTPTCFSIRYYRRIPNLFHSSASMRIKFSSRTKSSKSILMIISLCREMRASDSRLMVFLFRVFYHLLFLLCNLPMNDDSFFLLM